ncbi:hypothetical protein PL8927_550203 [Planktothrix serta PCC 8927]|uniref:Uncharacterized protein n=1 Tax=Planktothrix serta PCC 8927 TaxID=671068 RepID=A0A7Z9BT56_9CYAN|nr:hypothetical protein [Planktothrix serta]VXD17103.1 hypothetical protein PL8927_550203 [Planktothrix serta PCC 8927]
MDKLSDDTILYRAITNKKWIDPDTKAVDAEAFILRWFPKREEYEKALSAALKPEQAYNRLFKCWGVICLTVRDVRELGLDAIQDKPDHVSIINVPNPQTNEKEATDIPAKLAKKAWLYLDRLDDPIINKK